MPTTTTVFFPSPLSLLFLLPLGYLLGNLILWPLRKHDTGGNRPVQFRIADFYLLLAQMMISGAAYHGAYGDRDAYTRLAVAGMAWLLLAFWWWRGIRLLSRVGLARNPYRSVTLGFTVPLAYGGPTLFLFFLYLLAYAKDQLFGAYGEAVPLWALPLMLPLAIFRSSYGIFLIALMSFVAGPRLARWARQGIATQQPAA